MKLQDDTHAATAGRFREGIGLIVFLVVAGLIIFAAYSVIIPVVLMSVDAGRDFSAYIAPVYAVQPALPVYGTNVPADDGDTRVTLLSARTGDATFTGQKYFIVIASLRNLRDDSTVTVPGGNFAITDTEGNTYYPQGIGSSIAILLDPGQEETTEVQFLIPGISRPSTLRFFYPEESGGTGQDPAVFRLE